MKGCWKLITRCYNILSRHCGLPRGSQLLFIILRFLQYIFKTYQYLRIKIREILRCCLALKFKIACLCQNTGRLSSQNHLEAQDWIVLKFCCLMKEVLFSGQFYEGEEGLHHLSEQGQANLQHYENLLNAGQGDGPVNQNGNANIEGEYRFDHAL